MKHPTSATTNEDPWSLVQKELYSSTKCETRITYPTLCVKNQGWCAVVQHIKMLLINAMLPTSLHYCHFLNFLSSSIREKDYTKTVENAVPVTSHLNLLFLILTG
jgi:hypothetical protein